MQVTVHLENEYEFCDSNVAVVVDLPCAPVVGDIIYLTKEQRELLNQKAFEHKELFESLVYNINGVEGVDSAGYFIVSARAMFAETGTLHIELKK